MGRNRKKNEAQIAALKSILNERQSEFELFLENSSCTENPNHERELKEHVRKITELQEKIKMLSK